MVVSSPGTFHVQIYRIDDPPPWLAPLLQNMPAVDWSVGVRYVEFGTTDSTVRTALWELVSTLLFYRWLQEHRRGWGWHESGEYLVPRRGGRPLEELYYETLHRRHFPVDNSYPTR